MTNGSRQGECHTRGRCWRLGLFPDEAVIRKAPTDARTVLGDSISDSRKWWRSRATRAATLIRTDRQVRVTPVGDGAIDDVAEAVPAGQASHGVGQNAPPVRCRPCTLESRNAPIHAQAITLPRTHLLQGRPIVRGLDGSIHRRHRRGGFRRIAPPITPPPPFE
jgi:hypothetical protein